VPLFVLVTRSVAGKLFFAISSPLVPLLCSAQSRILLLTALARVKYKKDHCLASRKAGNQRPHFSSFSRARLFSLFFSSPADPFDNNPSPCAVACLTGLTPALRLHPPLRSISSLSEDRLLQTCDLLSSHSLPLISISFKIVASRSWSYKITSILKTYLGNSSPSSQCSRVLHTFSHFLQDVDSYSFLFRTHG